MKEKLSNDDSNKEKWLSCLGETQSPNFLNCCHRDKKSGEMPPSGVSGVRQRQCRSSWSSYSGAFIFKPNKYIENTFKLPTME